MMWDGYGYGMGSWIGMGFMMFFGLLVLIGIVLLIVWIARSAGGMGGMGGMHMGQHDGRARACDIARERYARGEITKEQYDEICKTVSA